MDITNIYVLTEARSDLDIGKEFYDQQNQGIGMYFRDSIISDIESLVIYAAVHPKRFGFYRMTSKRFPFSIYYNIKDNNAYVIAILPDKREPSWIIDNLTPRQND